MKRKRGLFWIAKASIITIRSCVLGGKGRRRRRKNGFNDNRRGKKNVD